MALITIHNRHIRRLPVWVIAVVVVAVMTPVVVTASGRSDIFTDSDPAPRTAVADPSFGPNQDLAPLWGIERSPAEATRGPNQDLAPLWDS